MMDSKTPGSRQQRSGGPGRRVKFAALGFSVLMTLGALEAALRLVPRAISPKLLILFEPGLRARIAAGAFPLQKDFREVVRDDGGPPLFVPRPDSPIVSIDPTADGVERSTDEMGFCNPAGRYAGRERIDVIAIGDSFTWCHAVLPGQAWPALLGDRSGLSTYSLGLGGNGPYEYVQYLREFGIAKQPRAVIMNIYGGNDLRDAVAYRDYRDAIARGERPASRSTEHVAPALMDSVVGRHSYAFNLLLAVASRVADKDKGDWEKAGINFRYQLLLPGGAVEFNVENRDRDEIVSARHEEDGSTPLSIWEGALRRFGELAREHGFTAIVAYTPPAYAAYGDRVRLADPSLAPLLARFDDAQRGFLAAHAAPAGYAFHDLTPALRAASVHADASGLLYGAVHVHLSARGNEVVAEDLAKFLEEQGIGPVTAARP
jgi:hypothetical protein